MCGPCLRGPGDAQGVPAVEIEDETRVVGQAHRGYRQVRHLKQGSEGHGCFICCRAQNLRRRRGDFAGGVNGQAQCRGCVALLVALSNVMKVQACRTPTSVTRNRQENADRESPCYDRVEPVGCVASRQRRATRGPLGVRGVSRSTRKVRQSVRPRSRATRYQCRPKLARVWGSTERRVLPRPSFLRYSAERR